MNASYPIIRGSENSSIRFYSGCVKKRLNYKLKSLIWHVLIIKEKRIHFINLASILHSEEPYKLASIDLYLSDFEIFMYPGMM